MFDKYGSKTILLERDCNALLVPHGHNLLLTQGSAVRVTQSLGDNFTVEVQGNLVLIMGEDRDALGFDPVDENEHAILLDDKVSMDEKCQYQIKRCYDPEIPVNISDLGLVYNCQVLASDTNKDMHIVNVVMTLTSPTCGMGPILIEEVKRKLMQIKSVHKVEIELVFEPPWSKDMISTAAKLQLGII